MKYTFVFLLVTVICLIEASLIGGWGWLLLWPGLAFLGVSLGYAGLGPQVFGKRADGTLPLWSMVGYFPYLAMTWILWHVQRRLARDSACHQIAPGLWLGRRLLPGEVPAGVTLIVDLTAEFNEPDGVRRECAYLMFPILDRDVPDAERLQDLVKQIVASSGEVVIHCASGRGRSAMVVACVLIAKGLAHNGAEAEAMIKAIRHIGLSDEQRSRIEEYARGRAG